MIKTSRQLKDLIRNLSKNKSTKDRWRQADYELAMR